MLPKKYSFSCFFNLGKRMAWIVFSKDFLNNVKKKVQKGYRAATLTPPSLHQYKPCSKLKTWRRHSTHPGLPLSERIVRLVKPSRGSTSSIAAIAHCTTWSILFTDVLQAESRLFGGFHAIDLFYCPWSFYMVIFGGQRLRDLVFIAPTLFLPSSTSSTHLGIGGCCYIPLWR